MQAHCRLSCVCWGGVGEWWAPRQASCGAGCWARLLQGGELSWQQVGTTGRPKGLLSTTTGSQLVDASCTRHYWHTPHHSALLVGQVGPLPPGHDVAPNGHCDPSCWSAHGIQRWRRLPIPPIPFAERDLRRKHDGNLKEKLVMVFLHNTIIHTVF